MTAYKGFSPSLYRCICKQNDNLLREKHDLKCEIPKVAANLLEESLEGKQAFLGPAGQIEVNGCPHTRAQAGGAGVENPYLGSNMNCLPDSALTESPTVLMLR